MNDLSAQASMPSPHGRASVVCRFCASPRLRRSRLRMQDGWTLLSLRWPVRCMECNKRQPLSWGSARQAKAAGTPHEGLPELDVNWQNFTSGHDPVLRIKKDKGDA